MFKRVIKTSAEVKAEEEEFEKSGETVCPECRTHHCGFSITSYRSRKVGFMKTVNDIVNTYTCSNDDCRCEWEVQRPDN